MRSPALLALLALPLAPAVAQERLIGPGDHVPGLGTVTAVVDGPATSDLGAWAAHVTAGATAAVVVDGQAVWVEGDAMPGVPATFEAPVAYDLTAAATLAMVAAVRRHDGVACSGAWLGAAPLAIEGEPAVADGLPPGAVWTKVHTLDANGGADVLVRGEVDLGAGALDALVLYEPAPDGGPHTARLFALEGQDLAGVGTVGALGSTHQIALDEDGGVLFVASGSAGVGLQGGGGAVAAVGAASPGGGAAWASFDDASVALRDGVPAYTGELEGGARLLVRGGLPYVQDGDAPPAVAPSTVDLAVTRHLALADGRLAWAASWSGAGGAGSGIFVEETLVVEVGVSHVEGSPVLALQTAHPRPYALDASGAVHAFVLLDEGAVIARWAPVLPPLVTPLPACTTNLGSLTHAGGVAAPGEVLVLAMDDAQAAGAVAFLAFSTTTHETWPPCGLTLPGAGEVLIAVTPPNPIAVLGGGAVWTGSPLAFHVQMPDWPVGSELFAQGVFVDVGGTSTEGLRLTGAVGVGLGTVGKG